MSKKSFQKSDFNSGGQPTNSPPANAVLPLDDFKVLSSGVDTLYLSVEVKWPRNSSFFKSLAEAKERAKSSGLDEPLNFSFNNSSIWKFNVKKTGSKGGYEWLMMNKEYTLKISSSIEPKAKPNVMVEIRSETLWSNGHKESCYKIIKFLEHVEAIILKIKPSRVDLCLDFVFPDEMWIESLLDYRVTRADSTAKYFSDRQVKGFTIGKSKIHARIYDKCLEIKQKSNKTWMYDKIWKIDSEPTGKKVIRVEFQLVREILKELNINSLNDLFKKLFDIWSYCTCDWLRFADCPEKRATLRKTLDWWKVVQAGFINNQEPNPLTRKKIFNAEQRQLFNQAYGMMTSLYALQLEKNIHNEDVNVDLDDCLIHFLLLAENYNKTTDMVLSDVINKRTKYNRPLAKTD